MGLRWDLTKCENIAELQAKKQWPITEAMIFRCMSVGLMTITEKNVEEFHTRSCMLERIDGPFFSNSKGEGESLGLDTIRRYIGLSTNVSNSTRTQFNKRIMDSVRRDAEYATRRAKDKLAQPDPVGPSAVDTKAVEELLAEAS